MLEIKNVQFFYFQILLQIYKLILFEIAFLFLRILHTMEFLTTITVTTAFNLRYGSLTFSECCQTTNKWDLTDERYNLNL